MRRILRVSISSELPVLLIADDAKVSKTVSLLEGGRVCWSSVFGLVIYLYLGSR